MSKTLTNIPKPMTLKHPDGYIGQVEMDEVADILSGRVIGIRDGITFEGKTPKEVKKAFNEAIDAYKALCKREGKEPERSFSGNIPFRTTPKIHEDIYKASQLAGQSINSWMNDILAAAVQKALTATEEKSSRAVEEPLAAIVADQNAIVLQVLESSLEAARQMIAALGSSRELTFTESTLRCLGTLKEELVTEIPLLTTSTAREEAKVAEPEATRETTERRTVSAT